MKKFKLGDYVSLPGIENSLAEVIARSATKIDVKFIYDNVYGDAVREYSKKDLIHFKYQKYDLVVYDGLIAIIDRISKYHSGGICLDLTSTEDEELTCTADITKCDPYTTDTEIDQSEALNEAYMARDRITNMVGQLTDKYYRDGNH